LGLTPTVVPLSVGFALVLTWAILAFALWLAYHLLRQNGRTLRRIEALEADFDILVSTLQKAGAPTFGDRSLAKSRINRNGLTPGTFAPSFRLPRLDGGGELSLDDYKGRRVLLVFSDPDCGPCDALAPRLEQLANDSADVSVVMVSRGDIERNRTKVALHRLTFPVVIQEHWQLSKQYAKFETPIAYLIDEEGRISAPVALGVEAILGLASAKPAALAGRR
jgi:peroxiredoxin